MVDDAVFPELSALVTAQKTERASHTAAIDDQRPCDSLGVIPLGFHDEQVNQPVNDLLAEKQRKHRAERGHRDTALGRDHIKAVKIRVVSGYENQIVECDNTAENSD